MIGDGMKARDLVDHLHAAYGHGWFNPQMARVRRATLLELAAKGLLEVSQQMYSSTTLNFRVKPVGG